MPEKILLEFHNISYAYEGQIELDSFSMKLCASESVAIVCELPTQYQALWSLLHRRLPVNSGFLEVKPSYHIYSDEMILKGLNLDHNIVDALQSRLFHEIIWLGGRRRQVESLMEELQIKPSVRVVPLRLLEPSIFHRCWLLLWILTKSSILVADELLKKTDKYEDRVLKQWFDDYLGGIIMLNPKTQLLSLCQQKVLIHARGQSSIGGSVLS